MKAMGRGQVRLKLVGLAYRPLGYEFGHNYHCEHAIDGSPAHEQNEKLLTGLGYDAANPSDGIRYLKDHEEVC